MRVRHKAPRADRKPANIAHLGTADRDVQQVALAGKMQNALSIRRDLQNTDVGVAVYGAAQPAQGQDDLGAGRGWEAIDRSPKTAIFYETLEGEAGGEKVLRSGVRRRSLMVKMIIVSRS